MTDATPQPGDRIPSLDPAPEVVAQIDRLAAASRADPSDQWVMTDLWRAVLGLERWIFIARGTPEQATPYVAMMADVPMLLAFTTAERAKAGGLAVGLPDDEARRLIASPLPGAVTMASSLLPLGVLGFLVDHGTTGAFTMLQNLEPMRAAFAEHPQPRP